MTDRTMNMALESPPLSSHAPVPHVVAKNVTKRFRASSSSESEVVAVDDASFTLHRSTFTSIVGPSGCGKTTLLRIIAGLETLSAGQLSVMQTDSSRPINAMVFQDQSVFPWMTTRENIEYGLRASGFKRDRRREISDRWLAKVGLQDFSDSYPHQLSGGMKQRTSLARALALRPELLLMDEPFAAVDEQTRLTLQNELLGLWDESPTTVVFVTHSIEEALTLSDEVIVMAARPARVVDRIVVPFDRPRNAIALRSDPAFGELMQRIWKELG